MYENMLLLAIFIIYWRNMSELEELLNKSLAKDFGITPSEVTCEYIYNWRMEKVYPQVSYERKSLYGGYITHLKRILTNREVKEVHKNALAFLSRV